MAYRSETAGLLPKQASNRFVKTADLSCNNQWGEEGAIFCMALPPPASWETCVSYAGDFIPPISLLLCKAIPQDSHFWATAFIFLWIIHFSRHSYSSSSLSLSSIIGS
ncbi:hypothetical protein SRHO_G00249250 [Serrasalmus rhombeus]